MKSVITLVGAVGLVVFLAGGAMAQSSGAGVPNPATPAQAQPKATNGAPIQAPAKAGAMMGAVPMTAKKKVAPKEAQ